MFQWFRNSKGRLVKIMIPHESQETDPRVSLDFDQMEPVDRTITHVTIFKTNSLLMLSPQDYYLTPGNKP